MKANLLKKKKSRIKTRPITAFALFFLMLFPSLYTLLAREQKANAYVLQTWHLVDSGKHLDWDGNSKYMTEWYASIKVWNSYKPGVIRVDTMWIIEDCNIADYTNNATNVIAFTSSNGQIRFNRSIMDGMTPEQRQHTIMHEIGHALGLGHVRDGESIMRQGMISQTTLSQDDKDGYDAAYKKY